MEIESSLYLIPLLPLVGFLVNGLLGNQLPKWLVAVIACTGPFIAFLLSVQALQALATHPEGLHQAMFSWISTGTLNVPFGLQVDALTAIMLMNVTGIGTAIHLYSYGYMHADPSFSRFMAYLNLFLAAMLMLVMGDNLLLLFVGWEGVGLCSYLLIGFWYQDFANVDAGRKAFIVNRIGDFAFLIGAFTLYSLTGTLEWHGMEQAVAALDLNAMVVSGPMTGMPIMVALMIAGLCLFGGATGKSAQIPLYVWLPDAMAGPTPVSALIHAATMVTAGIYLLGRMDFLFVLLPAVMGVIALVAACTALLSGLIAIAQNDIKKVLAYSTVSQLGFMFAGMATGFFHTGLFHVVTHAFFKALLFLGAGAVIVAMHHEQDIRKMGGLWKDLKGVSILFIIGSLALAGVPPFAGFYSKDAILAAVYYQAASPGASPEWMVIFGMLVFTAGLTAFYTTRLVVLTFFGKPADEHRHLHEVHWTMMAVLAFLAALSALAGVLGLGTWLDTFTHHVWSPPAVEVNEALEHTAHYVAMGSSTAVVVLGIGAGLFLYLSESRREALDRWTKGSGARVYGMASHKFFVDEFYEAFIVNPIGWLAKLLWGVVDRIVIDSGIVEGSALSVSGFSAALRHTQVGAVSAATTSTLVGVIVVVLWLVLHG